VLDRNPDGIKARDVFPEVEKEAGMTEFEAANYPGSDVRRFEKTVRFVTINAVKAGWMVKEAGVWTLTDEGVQAYKEIDDPEQLLLKAQKLYRAWEKEQPEQAPPVSQEEADEELSGTSVTLERAEEDSWDEVREVLRTMDPYDFQELVAGLLRGMGYFVEWISPPGKDKGSTWLPSPIQSDQEALGSRFRSSGRERRQRHLRCEPSTRSCTRETSEYS